MTTEDLEFIEYSLLNTINDIKSRRALTLAWNDGQTAFMYASVLIYLTIEYLGQKKNHQLQLDQHDGFMIKTPKDAEIELGIHSSQIRTIYTGLEGKGLIEIKKQGQDNRTCIKVDIEAVNNLLKEYLAKYEEKKNSYVEEKKEKIEARKTRAKKATKIDFDKINEISENNDPKEIGDVCSDDNDASLIYCANHYYKQFTGDTFKWSAGDFNTMMQPWKDRWRYAGAELGLAIAIYKAINDKSKLYFGQKFKQHFSIQPNRTDIPEGVTFDNILQMKT